MHFTLKFSFLHTTHRVFHTIDKYLVSNLDAESRIKHFAVALLHMSQLTNVISETTKNFVYFIFVADMNAEHGNIGAQLAAGCSKTSMRMQILEALPHFASASTSISN